VTTGARIQIDRAKGGRTDKLRAYAVVLDGVKVARVKRGETCTIETDAGHANLHDLDNAAPGSECVALPVSPSGPHTQRLAPGQFSAALSPARSGAPKTIRLRVAT